MAELKEELAVSFDLLRIFFRDVLVALSGGGRAVGSSLAGEIVRAAERWNPDQLSARIRAVDTAQKALARNCNRGLVCEVLLLELFLP
ncbi:hypothetical protein ACLG6S_04270 [Thermodesulfobacteriota bacterium B35]